MPPVTYHQIDRGVERHGAHHTGDRVRLESQERSDAATRSYSVGGAADQAPTRAKHATEGAMIVSALLFVQVLAVFIADAVGDDIGWSNEMGFVVDGALATTGTWILRPVIYALAFAAPVVAFVFALVVREQNRKVDHKNAPNAAIQDMPRSVVLVALTITDLFLVWCVSLACKVTDPSALFSILIISVNLSIFIRASRSRSIVVLTMAAAARVVVLATLGYTQNLRHVDDGRIAAYAIYVTGTIVIDVMSLLGRMFKGVDYSEQRKPHQCLLAMSAFFAFGWREDSESEVRMYDPHHDRQMNLEEPDVGIANLDKELTKQNFGRNLAVVTALNAVGFIVMIIVVLLADVKTYVVLFLYSGETEVSSYSTDYLTYVVPLLWAAGCVPVITALLLNTFRHALGYFCNIDECCCPNDTGRSTDNHHRFYADYELPAQAIQCALGDALIVLAVGPIMGFPEIITLLLFATVMASSSVVALSIYHENALYHLWAALGSIFPFIMALVAYTYVDNQSSAGWVTYLIGGLYLLRSIATLVVHLVSSHTSRFTLWSLATLPLSQFVLALTATIVVFTAGMYTSSS